MRVALVTGAARGLGRAIAADLGQDHHVAISYYKSNPGPLIAERPDVFALQANLENSDEAERVVSEVINRFGRLDVLVNNAGMIAMDNDAGFDTARQIFDVNVIAPMALLSAALPYLKPGAAVVNVSSVNAKLPATGASVYSASKAALNTWTKGMAKEMGARGIRVNAVAPGATERSESPRSQDLIDAFVGMTALGRIGQPEDIAAAVRFLASDAASFITGEVLNVNGGYRL